MLTRQQIKAHYRSHPSRVCGLKSVTRLTPIKITEQSHPSRVCGLKSLKMLGIKGSKAVAPFAGVWIEIWGIPIPELLQSRRTLRGCVD